MKHNHEISSVLPIQTSFSKELLSVYQLLDILFGPGGVAVNQNFIL